MIIEAQYSPSSSLPYLSEGKKKNDSPAAVLSSNDDDHTFQSERQSSTLSGAVASVEVPESSSSYGNVWYRRYLKHFIRKNRRVPYKESFRNRVIQPVGIPARASLRGIHELFTSSHRQYSPLIGMIFSYNHYIDNVLRYGEDDEQDPEAKLIRMLFHILPGGEIQPTHIERNAAAHLSPGLVGAILEAWEASNAGQSTVNQDMLEERIHEILVSHPDHIDSRKGVLEQVENARLELDALTERDRHSKATRDKIKALEGDVIKLNKHRIKRLENDMTITTDEDTVSQIQEDIKQCRLAIEEAEVEVTNLRKQIVTSFDKKQARKALKRAEEAAELEKQGIVVLADALAGAFCSTRPKAPVPPDQMTIAILQAYLWRKYNTIAALKPYFESMNRIGALSTDLKSVFQRIDANTQETASSDLDKAKPNKFVAPKHQEWSPDLLEEAATIIIGETGTNDRPPIIPFSYITWAAYSEFPDCGETALRNLMNQIVFNADTGRFDVELLEELHDRFYPRMSTRLIDFYRRHSRTHDVTDQQVSVDWIDVVSNLNRDRDEAFPQGTRVRYRREAEEKNIASPLSNLLRTINALFGADYLDDVQFVEDIGNRINELRGDRSGRLVIDLSGLKPGGFGILSLSAGGVRYELQSYKPVHFGFVQVEKRKEQSRAERYDHEAFCKLMKYTSSKKHAIDPTTGTMSVEKLALASLFVPYHLKQSHVGALFGQLPPQVALLFADLDKKSARTAALRWADDTKKTEQHPRLFGLLKRIENYVEPKFGPSKRK